MLKLVKEISELEIPDKGPADCYVSCTADESMVLLEPINVVLKVHGDFGISESFLDHYSEKSCFARRFLNSQEIVMDIVDFPLEEDMVYRKLLGFPSQSRMRIYSGKHRFIEGVAKMLTKNQQNFAFVNEQNNRAYVSICPSYHIPILNRVRKHI